MVKDMDTEISERIQKPVILTPPNEEASPITSCTAKTGNHLTVVITGIVFTRQIDSAVDTNTPLAGCLFRTGNAVITVKTATRKTTSHGRHRLAPSV